jgi:hypothetical protein
VTSALRMTKVVTEESAAWSILNIFNDLAARSLFA